MNTHLPADLEQFVQAKVRRGRFHLSEVAITAAVRLLAASKKKPRKPRILNGIRPGPGGHSCRPRAASGGGVRRHTP